MFVFHLSVLGPTFLTSNLWVEFHFILLRDQTFGFCQLLFSFVVWLNVFAHIGSDSLLLFVFFSLSLLFTKYLALFHPNPHPFRSARRPVLLSLCDFIDFCSVSLAYFFLRPSELLYPRTLIFGCGAIPGVSGTLEGPSFQNHGPQRTHQTAYAKRESRCRSAGFRRNLGDVLFTCHFISRSFFFQIIISKFCSTTNNSGPIFPLPNNDDRLEICFIF